jgi:hypothetical protein
MINHTHEYNFWHIHEHSHGKDVNYSLAAVGLKGISSETHNTGHYHLFTQIHEHGSVNPHSHKERQYHPQDSDVIHHHAVKDHEEKT